MDFALAAEPLARFNQRMQWRAAEHARASSRIIAAMQIKRVISRGIWGLLLVYPAVGIVGCASPEANMELLQPQLVGPQQRLPLASEQVAWAAAGDTERVLIEFPLPGASTGRPTYLLYLRLPAGETVLKICADPGRCVRGFFIQTTGDFAGLANVTGGELHVKKHGRNSKARELTFSLTCEDGSKLQGQARAEHDHWALQEFETHRRPHDVRELLKPAAIQSSATAR